MAAIIPVRSWPHFRRNLPATRSKVRISPIWRYGGVPLPELTDSEHIRYAPACPRSFKDWQGYLHSYADYKPPRMEVCTENAKTVPSTYNLHIPGRRLYSSSTLRRATGGSSGKNRARNAVVIPGTEVGALFRLKQANQNLHGGRRWTV